MIADKIYRINCNDILIGKISLINGSYNNDLIKIAQNVDQKFHHKNFLFAFGDKFELM